MFRLVATKTVLLIGARVDSVSKAETLAASLVDAAIPLIATALIVVAFGKAVCRTRFRHAVGALKRLAIVDYHFLLNTSNICSSLGTDPDPADELVDEARQPLIDHVAD